MPLADLPDILLVSVDTMRRDRMAPYGQDLMPTATSLLEEGVAFDQCIAPAPWTGASFGSLLTGLWPRQHGLLANRSREGAPQSRSPLRSDVRVLAEMLRDAGYHTLCAQANIGFMVPSFGVHRGFAEYAVWSKNWWRGPMREEWRWLLHALQYEGLRKYVRFTLHRLAERANRNRVPRRAPMQAGETILQVALRMLRRAPEGKPVFLWVNFMDMHDPYCVPKGWEGDRDNSVKTRPVHLRPHGYPEEHLSDEDKRHARRCYDATARYTDHCLGGLLARWERARRSRTRGRLTVFTSDHGEEFWDHGDTSRDPLFYTRGVAHGHTLYGELIHVPLVFHFPGVVAAARRVAGPVSLVDLVPTLVELLGLEEDTSSLAGRSLVGCLTSSSAPKGGARHVFSEAILTGPERQACCSARYKLIHCTETGETELYAWGNDDADEQVNLANSPAHADALTTLKEALDGRTDEPVSAAAEAFSPEEEEQIAARLRDLGYL